MASRRCSVCGIDLGVAVLSEQASDASQPEPSVEKASLPTCPSCMEKLKNTDLASTHRTTIMRPVGGLNVNGRAILAPTVESEDSPLTYSTPHSIPTRSAVDAQRPISKVDVSSSPCARSGNEGVGSSIVKVGDQAISLSSNRGEGLVRQFGPYEILNEISRGSFGVVYKARQPGLDRIVALKVLLAGVHASGEAVARFQREAKAVARLKHPNIVPVYDIGMQDMHHYFAMEFIEGCSLAVSIAQKKVTSVEALSIAEQISEAIETAHRAGVIHRDIKPSNILMDAKGKPHLTDFGLAKQVDLDTKYTVSGTTLGTPAYMPPEQARGEVERIDARSDVYSLGAVMYEMLTGRTPYVGRSLLEVVVAVINEPLTPPRQLNPKIHRDVQTIIQKCLEKDPRQRYDSAEDLAEDIKRFRSGEAIRARPAGMLRRVGRFVQRQSLLISATCLVLIAVGFSTYRVYVSNKQISAISKENKELRKEAVKSKEVLWLPDWWFPIKTAEELVTEELHTRYKMTVGHESSFEGLVSSSKDVPDLIDGKPTTLSGAKILVSAEDCHFFGDVVAEVRLQINEDGIANGLRIGLQSFNSDRDHHGIPYLLEYKNRRIRIIGPTDIFSYMINAGRKTPKLEVKAEKETADLLAGDYTLKIHREGLNLSFQLVGPQPSLNAMIEIRDLNLSNWVFKNTQLTVRTPPKSGLDVLSAEVKKKYGGEEEEAFGFFRSGEYDGAKKGLEFLVESDDHYKRAMALYQLGMIQEICTPKQIIDYRAKYMLALQELDQIRDEKLAEKIRILRRELQIRKVITFAQDRDWTALRDELNRVWRGHDKIEEIFSWELVSILEKCVSPPSKESIEAALSIIQHLGVRPGSARIGSAVTNLALLLIVEDGSRIDDLLAIHTAYPAPELNKAFFEAIHQSAQTNRIAEGLQVLQYITPHITAESELLILANKTGELAAAALHMKKYSDVAKIVSLNHLPAVYSSICAEIELRVKELASDDFGDFITHVLPTLSAHLPQDPITSAKLTKACTELVKALVGSGRINEIVELHKALRGIQNKSDSRLAASFASTIQLLATGQDPSRHAQAIELLQYCFLHVASNDSLIQQAALALSRPQATLDENRYAKLLSIQNAYPTPDILPLILGVLLELNKRQLYPDAILFYGQARVLFHDSTGRLMHSVITALSNLRSDDQRLQHLNTLWHTVKGEFDTQKNEFAIRAWSVDYGDILWSLGQWEKARDYYQQISSAYKIDPLTSARASLRLATLVTLHPDTTIRGEVLQPLLAVDELPMEYKLAARVLGANPPLNVVELEKELKTLASATPSIPPPAFTPIALTPAEWALFKGIRLRLEGNQAGALEMLKSASDLSRSGPAWTQAPATQLYRARPEELHMSPDMPLPGPPTAPKSSK